MEKTCSGMARKGRSHYKTKSTKVKVVRETTDNFKVLSNEDLRRNRINRFRRDKGGLSFEAAEKLYYQLGMDEFER